MKDRQSQAAAERLIREITDRIIERLRPQKVILFGSQAEGRATADSDIDLLVVMETDLKPRERALMVRETLKGLYAAVDVFALTPQEYVETKDVIGGITYPATKYGKVLYEKS